MLQKKRHHSIAIADGMNRHLLNRYAYCRKHHLKYPMNVMNNDRLEAGKCPECYPPKPPAPPEGSTT